MTEWLAWLREVASHMPAAMVAVLATEGSAPRGAGTRMLVTADTLLGTIGGGELEYRAVAQARAILAHPAGTWRVQDYPLGPLLGQCCGGRVRLLVEHVDAAGLDWLADAAEGRTLVSTLTAHRVERRVCVQAMPNGPSARGPLPDRGTIFAETIGRYRRPVFLFGAGHVGQAIMRHAELLPLDPAWFDSRAAFEGIDRVVLVPETAIERCVADAPDDAAIVIMTHDHALDYRLTLAALRREHAAFIGLIGSATKAARFRSRLADDGVSEARRARLISPIGLAGVTGKEPDVIAIAVLAQLLQLPPPLPATRPVTLPVAA